jgi:hypothetical protein
MTFEHYDRIYSKTLINLSPLPAKELYYALLPPNGFIKPAIKYLNYVIPACPESFFTFDVLRRLIPDKRG